MHECGTETTIYRFGGLARGTGKDATDNPFAPLTDEWFDWADGWKDADEFFHKQRADESQERPVRSRPPSPLALAAAAAAVMSADDLRPGHRRWTPQNCPGCEYDRRFPGFEGGGWLQQDNNGPIVSCPLCNPDGAHTRS